MDKTSMVRALIGQYTSGNKAQFANLIGVAAQTISAWIARSTFDAELIYAKCRGVSAHWLLTGEGEMIATEPVGECEKCMIANFLREKDQKICEQAEEIGRLKERITTLEREKGKSASHAPTADAADAV